MPYFPRCVTCHSTDSEVDVIGQCTTCASRASGLDTRNEQPVSRPKPPRLRAFELPREHADAAPTTKDGDTPAPEAPRPNSSSQQFPDYTALEFIERGGMGVIYRAIESMTGRVVAVKTMNVLAHADSRLSQRFRTEATALARLSHPGVVQIFKAGEQDDVPYLAMEFVPGGSLAKRLRSGPRPTPREAADLMAGVASALAAAHARNIIHRDLKPSNILLTDAGRPKLTDFGLASLTDQLTNLTASGATIGTPSYMAPEQAGDKSFGPVGPLSDVYGLGATLYELLTGRPPFIGDSSLEILDKIRHDPVIPPRSLNPAVPVDLERICLRCLEKQPADRYASAALVANDLSRFLRGEAVGKPTLAFRFKKVVRRYGKIAAAVLAVSVVAVSMGAALFRTPDKPIPATPKPDRAAYLATQAQKLKAGQEIDILPPNGDPDLVTWVRGNAAIRSGTLPRGEFGFRADALEKSPSLLELVPDTYVDSFEITGWIKMCEGGNFNSLVGIYFMEPEKEGLRQTRIVGICEFVHPASTDGRNPFEIKDYLTLNLNGNIIAAQNKHDISLLRFTPYGEHPKDFRPITIVVTPEKIVARLGGLFGPNDADEVYVESSLAAVDDHRQRVARPRLDEFAITRGRVLAPMPSRGAIGLCAKEAEITVRNLRFKPIPTP